jgi:hypothetical protein
MSLFFVLSEILSSELKQLFQDRKKGTIGCSAWEDKISSSKAEWDVASEGANELNMSHLWHRAQLWEYHNICFHKKGESFIYLFKHFNLFNDAFW